MPATRDRSHRIAFVYANLYKIYRSNPESWSHEGPMAVFPYQGRVLKAGDRNAASGGSGAFFTPQNLPFPAAKPGLEPEIREYVPRKLVPSNSATPVQQSAPKVPAGFLSINHAINESSKNESLQTLGKLLGQLEDLQSRLKFILAEIESNNKKG